VGRAPDSYESVKIGCSSAFERKKKAELMTREWREERSGKWNLREGRNLYN
jgi:hypothetical protein